MPEIQPYLAGMESEERRRDLSQFYTDPALARRVWAWARQGRAESPFRVLEPAAGRGHLIAPMFEGDKMADSVVAYEVDDSNVEALDRALVRRGWPLEVRHRDFLADPDPGEFDLALQNPPYEDDQEILFVEHALDCAPITVGIFRAAIVFGQGRWERLWRWTDVLREVRLSKRPDFGDGGGAGFGAKTDFLVLELARRSTPRMKGDRHAVAVEWW